MNISQITELQSLLDAYICHIDREIERAEYESPLYWGLVDRRAAAVAAYEATI